MLNSVGLSSPKYRADIDGLRAIAVLSVVGFHAFPNIVRGGFVGVDIFFVISGFLISTIIFQSLEENNFSLFQFYIRRIKRIFPALLVVLVVSFIFGWLVLFPDEYQVLGKHIAGSSVFISNFLLWHESGYFDRVAETKPLLHLWSLGVEEQFYIIWPLLLFFAWKKRLNLLSIIFIIMAISFALNMAEVKNNPTATFYSPQTRFWELLLGACLAYLKIKQKDNEVERKLMKSTIFSFLGILLILISIFSITNEYAYPGWLALLPTVGAAFIILADSRGWFNRKLLANHIMVWFGLISFPLYLWHWPLLSFARIMEGKSPWWVVRISMVVVSIFLAWLTYKFIERPIRFSGENKKIAFILVFFMVNVGIIGFGAKISNGYQYRPSYIETFMTQEVSHEFMDWKYGANELCLKRYPFDTNKYKFWFCMQEKDSEPTIMLIGSSFANQLYPGLSKNKKLNHHTVLSMGTCIAGLPGGYGDPDHPCFGDRVEKQCVFIDNIISKTKSLRYVIMDTVISTDLNYLKKLSERIKFIENLGVKVILLIPHLKPTFDIKACYKNIFSKKTRDCSFNFSEKEKQLQDFKFIMSSISQLNPNTLFFDQNDLYCEEHHCSYTKNGMPLYRDELHTSEYGSIKLSDIFVEWSEKNLPEILSRQ